jgi:DNA polymerase I
VASYRYYGSAGEKRPLSDLDGVRLIAVDLETYTATDPVPVGLGIAYSPTDAFYFSLLPPSSNIPWHLLTDPRVTKLMHNAPFDLRVLRDLHDGGDTTNIIDTAVMARMACIPANLEDACTAMETTTRPRHMKDVWAENHVNNSIDLGEDINAVKCCEDCLGTLQLYYSLMDQVDMDYVKAEMELLPILEEMSQRGLLIDQDVRYGLEVAYSQEMESLRDLCEVSFGLNPWSPPQVSYILSKRGNFLPTKRGKSGRWTMTTDEATLEKILHVEPLAGVVLRARHVRKMYGTYIMPAKGLDRMYTYFHLEAATARISSSSFDKRKERNLQNIPGEKVSGNSISMRNMFLPDMGTFTDTDFSQIELRVLAYLSNDHEMMDILNDPNGDIHQETANFLNIPRWMAKNCTFAIIYGATAQTVMETAHFQDIRRAQAILDALFRKYRNMGDWIRSTQEFARHHDYVTTMGGRRISVLGPETEILPTDNLRQIESKMANKDRKACNYPIQASAGEVMKRALKLARERVSAPMAHQVHDEIIWDGMAGTPADLDQLFNGSVAPFPTPTNTKYMERWN